MHHPPSPGQPPSGWYPPPTGPGPAPGAPVPGPPVAGPHAPPGWGPPAPAYPAHPGGYGPHPHPGGGFPPAGPSGSYPAGMVERFGGTFIDGWALTFVFYGALFLSAGLAAVLGLSDTAGTAVWLLGTFAGAVVYTVVPTMRWGRTLGKLMMNTRVVDVRTGRPPGLGRALLRSLLWLVCTLLWPILVICALVALGDDERRTLWDRAARTRVVKVFKHRPVAPPPGH